VRGDPGAQHAQLVDELERRRLADLEVAPERGQPDRPTTRNSMWRLVIEAPGNLNMHEICPPDLGSHPATLAAVDTAGRSN